MKKLLLILILFLFSAQGYAGVGDVYNCKEASAVTSMDDGSISNQNSTLTSFSFKRTKSEIRIEIPYTSMVYIFDVTSSNAEEFTAFRKDESGGGYEYLIFKNGTYINTSNVVSSEIVSVMTIIAKCQISKLY